MKEYPMIETGGIGFVAELDAAGGWYWGSDYTGGDLYEAEELYREGHRIRCSRLVFLHFPEGKLFEPVLPAEGCYFGRPIYYKENIYILSVDFGKETIRILRWQPGREPEEAACLPLGCVKDCYNLQLTSSPLCLVRQGHENDFQVVWPEKGAFAIAPSESLDSRDEDCLLFSQWFEDPDYREETVVRKVPSGEELARYPAGLFTAPEGSRWLLH